MKRFNAHPVWRMLIKAEMIRFRTKKILIDLPLPENENDDDELDEYCKTYGPKIYKEYKVIRSRHNSKT